jgi:hypothetical protein
MATKSSERLIDSLSNRQASLKVAKTTISPSGQIIDWIPIESQSSGPIASPPPPHTSEDAVVVDKNRPTTPLRFDIGEPGPAGHVPILRPDLSRLRDAQSLDEIMTKRGGLRINVNRKNRDPADPNPAGYFHATSSQTLQSYGCAGQLNVWDPKISLPASPGDDHSISQTWLQNYQTSKIHSIEAGLTVDQLLNGDLSNHLFVYFTTNSYASSGDDVGGYNRIFKGWVQTDPNVFPGLRMESISATGGNQSEFGLKFMLFNGDWWLGVNFGKHGEPWIWIGYYPGSLFTGGLSNFAERVAFGGEVYSSLPNPCDTLDQMGSGIQATGGYRIAAYQRNLQTQAQQMGPMIDFAGIAEVDAAATDCAVNNYTIACSMKSNGAWGSYQYFGGPEAFLLARFRPEDIWQWVDFGTMVDDGIHPWNPDFRYLLAGIVLADLAKFSSPSLSKEILQIAAKQIRVASDGIVKQIGIFSDNLET